MKTPADRLIDLDSSLIADFRKAKGKTVESKIAIKYHFPSTCPVLILALISLVHITV